ncbi:MAG: hypothetical protein FWF86_00540 [Clostridia bacterium]|nr:hypothetical protein [Clostridia bacterium]
MKVMLISHERGGSYIVDQAGRFQFVKGYDTYPPGVEIDFMPQVKPLRYYVKMVAVAVCLVIFVSFSCFTGLSKAESYSVFVDINPSVELVFNNLDKLKEAKSLNEEGAALMEGFSLSGSPERTVVALIHKAEAMGYFVVQDDLKAVSVMVATKGGNDPDGYRLRISDALKEDKILDVVDVDICKPGLLEKAEEYGISPGRLRLAETLIEFDQSMIIGDAIKMPVNDLVSAIKEAENKSKTNQKVSEREEIIGWSSVNYSIDQDVKPGIGTTQRRSTSKAESSGVEDYVEEKRTMDSEQDTLDEGGLPDDVSEFIDDEDGGQEGRQEELDSNLDNIEKEEENSEGDVDPENKGTGLGKSNSKRKPAKDSSNTGSTGNTNNNGNGEAGPPSPDGSGDSETGSPSPDGSGGSEGEGNPHGNDGISGERGRVLYFR